MTLFAGDLFEAIPFGDQPTMLHRADDGKHFVGEVAFAYGLLTTPTCDMAEQRDEGQAAHPIRVLVPVLPLVAVAEQAGAVANSMKLLRSRDTLHPYMYLPPLSGFLEEESVACLFRPSLVSDELLAEPPRRVAQLQPEARRHLKVKLAAYWGRVAVDPKELPVAGARRGGGLCRRLAPEPLRRSGGLDGQARIGVAERRTNVSRNLSPTPLNSRNLR